MGPADAPSSNDEEADMSRLSVSGTLSVPDKEQLELAEAILARLNPADSARTSTDVDPIWTCFRNADDDSPSFLVPCNSCCW